MYLEVGMLLIEETTAEEEVIVICCRDVFNVHDHAFFYFPSI